MKNKLIVLFLIFWSFANAQSTGKRIIITKIPKKVPAGKVWKLERGVPTIVQLNEGTLENGTLCNAMFLSNPGMIFNVNKGDYYKADGYGIIFKEFEKVEYTNDVTYKLTPISIVDIHFNPDDLSDKKPENVGTKEIIFKAGESVFVGSCFMTLELTEYNMSQADLEIEKKKMAAIEKEKQRLKASFNIPVNPERYSAPTKKPLLKDSLLNLIVFSSDGVLHKRPGKGFALDDQSVWTMTLSIDDFNLKSTNGINKSYKVLDIKYDDTLKMQEFQVGTFDGKYTHNLYISWGSSSEEYSVLLVAVDNSEEYQFQEVKATKKN